MMGDDQSFQVELYFAARNLKDLDVFSKSDPYVKLSMRKSMNGNIQSVGRTQTAPNTCNPNWKQKIPVRYYFQLTQPVVIQVYDEDSSKNSEFIGKVQTTMGKIMGAHLQTLILDISTYENKPAGKVIVRAQKIQESTHSLVMKWKGRKIANVDSFFDFFDKSDPYLKFMKVRQDNTFIEIARTEVLHDNQEPSWRPITIPASRLVDLSNPNSSFKIECWDFEQGNKQHQYIGQSYISVNDLKNKSTPIQFLMTNPKVKKPGKLYLDTLQIVQTPNFIDYLKSGLQLNLVAAIDFTGSNGIPSSANSLHYIAKQPTQYQTVMKSIWDIIENYDFDKKIPAFGFGAKPHFPNLNRNQAVHCFPINDNLSDPQIHGFDNLMNCYINAVKNMQFAGPTYFSPLLKEAFSNAQKLSNTFSYQILLILTDGQIHDMAATKDIIVQFSNLPMSIIIVGIGNSGFDGMQELDGDGGLYSSNGTKCVRDIVQFVPFRKFNGNPQILAAQLLREIPNQVTQYFASIGRMPEIIKAPNLQAIAPSADKNITHVIFQQNHKN